VNRDSLHFVPKNRLTYLIKLVVTVDRNGAMKNSITNKKTFYATFENNQVPVYRADKLFSFAQAHGHIQVIEI